MKTQEKSQVKDMTVGDLQVQLVDCEEKLAKLKFVHSMTPLKNPMELRTLKLQKARILTWIRQKAGSREAAEKIVSGPVAKAAPAKTSKSKKGK